MLEDLNDLLEKRMAGEDPSLDQFTQSYGNFLGPNLPSILDQLPEQMSERMAQLESLLRSMSPEIRRQLQELINSAMRDQGLLEEMTRLMENLDAICPLGDLRRD